MNVENQQLNQFFGGYRAEWLKEQLFELFTEPNYFPELETSKPCILVGGRGTGKTTVLRGLSYEGQFALHGKDTNKIKDLPYYGFYYRVNTNRVSAFSGPEVVEKEWAKLFAHYFNLILSDLVVNFLNWYQLNTQTSLNLNFDYLKKFAVSLHLKVNENSSNPSPQTEFDYNNRKQSKRTNNVSSLSLKALADSLDYSRIEFEAHINNIADGNIPPLSMQGAPIDILLSLIQELPEFKHKNFFFLVDEYENFEFYQQQVVNTLIKHSGEHYSFKVGVRELGLRCRTTLRPNEQLISPADYEKIDISQKFDGNSFKKFALSVCNDRLIRFKPEEKIIRDVKKLLPGLSEDEEAEVLGIDDQIKSLKSQFQKALEASEFDMLSNLSNLYIYFINFWAKSQKISLKQAYTDYINDTQKWDIRFDNNKHALLFTIRQGKAYEIQKYYAGWDTFIKLSANNIRYLLELVDQSQILHLREEGNTLSQPISYEIQTKAAQNVGKKNLSELEGLSVHGGQLTKLLLSLGRIFQIMASDAVGHAPEVTQFYINEIVHLEVEELLNSAVMHLALLRSPGNKLVVETDTRDYDYMVHPIFSAFFVFSYRRKRKTGLTNDEVLNLVKNPKSTIRSILARSNRYEEDIALPQQLSLFEGYYYGDNS